MESKALESYTILLINITSINLVKKENKIKCKGFHKY